MKPHVQLMSRVNVYNFSCSLQFPRSSSLLWETRSDDRVGLVGVKSDVNGTVFALRLHGRLLLCEDVEWESEQMTLISASATSISRSDGSLETAYRC